MSKRTMGGVTGLIMALAVGWAIWQFSTPAAIPPAVLTAVTHQLPPGATLLLPTPLANSARPTVYLGAVDEATLRDLLINNLSLYLLHNEAESGRYGATAVANLTWVRNHANLIEIGRYNDGYVLHWVVVTQGRSFGNPSLLVAPGS